MSELVQRHEFLPAPKTAQEAMQLAHTLAESKLIPKAFQHEPNDVFVAMMWSANLGVPVLQGIQGIAVINGKPSIYGDLGLAVCMSSGLVEGFKEEYFESKEKAKLRDGKDSLFNNAFYRCTIKRKGINEPFVKEFSVQDALTAGLWNKPGPWVQYPKRMLQMRARSYALRDAFPDLLMGMSFVEETQDIVDVTENGEVTSVTSAPKKMPVRKSKPSKVVEEPKKEAPEEPKEPQIEEPAALENNPTSNDLFAQPIGEGMSVPVEVEPVESIAETKKAVSEPMLKEVEKATANHFDESALKTRADIDSALESMQTMDEVKNLWRQLKPEVRDICMDLFSTKRKAIEAKRG